MREGRGRVMRMFDAGRHLWLIGGAGRLLLAGALRFTSMTKEGIRGSSGMKASDDRRCFTRRVGSWSGSRERELATLGRRAGNANGTLPIQNYGVGRLIIQERPCLDQMS